MKKLMEGNRIWRDNGSTGDLSGAKVEHLVNGQSPYAVIVTCSDSRVVPEAMFHAGCGDLFVIRTAGNTIGAEALGSIAYAVEHLGTRLILVLGHTHCGAVAASVAEGKGSPLISDIITKIRAAAGNEKNEERIAALNARYAAAEIREVLKSSRETDPSSKDHLVVAAGMFHLEDARVEILDDGKNKE